MRTTILRAALLLLLGAGTAGAVELTLDQAVDLALAEGYDARVEKLRLYEAEQNVRAARGGFGTQLGLDLDAPDYSESVQDRSLPGELPQYTNYGSRTWRGLFTLRQPLPTNGDVRLVADLSHRTDTVWDSSLDATSEQLSVFQRYRVQVSQPLFVPNTLKLALRRAELNLDEARRRFAARNLDIVYDVTGAFYGLLRAERGQAIARDEVDDQEEAHELAKSKFEAGLIPEVEALQMEVDLAQSRNDLLSAEGRLADAEDRFRLAVGLPLDAEVRLRASTSPVFYDIDEDLALSHALAHRDEIFSTEADLERAEITLKETDARSTIRGEVSGYYDLTGVGTGTGDDSFADLWRASGDDLERRPGNRGVVFTLSVPIWDSGVNAAEVAAARAALERSDLARDQQRRLVQSSVRSALTAVRESRARLEALARSEEVARRGLDISLQRFSNGDITTQELALDRDRLTSARQAWLDAFISYQLAGAELRRQTLYDFERGVPLVAAPVADE